MANEVHADHESGDSLYGVVYNSAGQANIAGGNTFEDWGDGASDADTYDFAITEVGTGGVRYVGDFPSTITTAGIYSVVSFLKLGASPADGDDIIGGQTIYWSGTAELTETQYSMNVAIPGSPTANSINERIAAVDDLTQASGDGDLAALASICTEARLAELDAAKLPTDIDFIKNVQEGDVSIDTSATPWQAVVKIKGTDTELIRKDLADKDGNNIASVNALIGRYTEPS